MPSLTSDEYQIKITTSANTAGAAEAKDALQGVQTKTEDVDDATKKAGSAFGGMVGQFALGNIVANAATNAFSDLKGQLTESVQLAEQQQNVTAQLNNALKGTKDASGMSLQGLQDLAEQTQKTTTFSKLDTEQAEQVMLTYTNIGKNVFPSTMTAAENLSTRFGVALPNAAKLLGRALEDPAKGTTTLSRYIGVLNPALVTQIKTMEAAGNTAGAQGLLLDQLNQKMGGSAVAAASTFSGQMAQLKNRVEDLKISIGQHLIGALMDSFTWFEKHRQLIKEIVEVVGPLAGGILLVVAALKVWELATKAFTAVQEAFDAVMDMNPVLLAIMAVAAIAILVVTHWNTVKQWFSDFISWITDHWKLLVDILFGPFGVAVTEIISHWGDIMSFFSGVIDWIKSHWALLVDILFGPFGIAVTMIIQHWGAIKTFFAGLPHDILGWIGDVGNLLYDVGKNIIDGLIKGVESMGSAVTQKITDITNGIKDVAKKILGVFSPSRVFMDIGVNVGQGLINGITSMQSPAAQASASLAQTSISSSQSALSNINSNNSSSSTSINNLNLIGGQGTQQLLQILNQNSLMTGKGLTPIGSSI